MSFDPDFNDCAWTNAWAQFAIIQPVPGVYGEFTVRSWEMEEAEICGEAFRLNPPLQVRGLVTADGQLWMSDVPQERLMMYNNAQLSRGSVLVGGLGLGLYPQYAMPFIERMTVVEESEAVIELVEPLIDLAAVTYGVEVEVQKAEVGSFLAADPVQLFDTIFLDTWATLDAAHLPAVNALRDRAEKHVAPGGRLLLWGYRWMVNLFLEACRQLLEVPPDERESWLQAVARQRADTEKLLMPVASQFRGETVDDMDGALAWCREYILTVTAGE